MNPIIKTELLGHIDISKIIAVQLEFERPFNDSLGGNGWLHIDVQLRDAPLKIHCGTFLENDWSPLSPEARMRAEWEPKIEEQILKPWRDWAEYALSPANQHGDRQQ